jgi:hypothetical protein
MQSWHHKKAKLQLHIFLSGILLLSFVFCNEQNASADQFKAQYYYPIPFASYGSIRLVPKTSDPASCQAGTIYYNDTSNELRFCNGGGASTTNDLWDKSGNKVTYKSYVNQQFRLENCAVGSLSVLNICHTDTIPPNYLNRIGFENISNGTNHALRFDGAIGTDAYNYARYIDFMVGNRSPDFDARMIYYYKTTQKGIGFSPNITTINPPLLWLDNTNLSVGVNRSDPQAAYKLDVNGDTQINNLCYGSCVTNKLMVGYSNVAGSEGYYAVYAP